jgi:hypothetical protein
MKTKFNGTYEELKEAIDKYGPSGEWREKGNHKQFRADAGGILNWWDSTKTLAFQGAPAQAEELKATFHTFTTPSTESNGSEDPAQRPNESPLRPRKEEFAADLETACKMANLVRDLWLEQSKSLTDDELVGAMHTFGKNVLLPLVIKWSVIFGENWIQEAVAAVRRLSAQSARAPAYQTSPPRISSVVGDGQECGRVKPRNPNQQDTCSFLPSESKLPG